MSLGSKHSGFVQGCQERCDQSWLSVGLGQSQEQRQPCQGVCVGDAHEVMFSWCGASLIVPPELKRVRNKHDQAENEELTVVSESL